MLWKKRVWREIDVSEKSNDELNRIPDSQNQHSFPNLLLIGIRKDSFKAYAAWDTGLSKPLTMQEVDEATSCSPGGLSFNGKAIVELMRRRIGKGKTVPYVDAISYEEIKKLDTTNMQCCYPQQIDKYIIVEDWIFDRNAGQMVVHIAAIAPVDGAGKILFWIKYPDARYFMAQHRIYAVPEEAGMSWDRYFESRQFSSKITRVEGVVEVEEMPDKGESRKKKKKKRKVPADEIFKQEKDVWIY